MHYPQVTQHPSNKIMIRNPRIVENAICAVSTPFRFSSKADAPLFCRVSVYCQGDWLELTDTAPYDEWEHTVDLDGLQYKVVYLTPDEIREACKDMATKDERLDFVDMQPLHLIFNQ